MKLFPLLTPAGSDTQIQYNNGGLFGGDSSLTWDDSAAKALTIAGASVIGLNSAVFQPATDSTTFFQIKNAMGDIVCCFDTTNKRFGVGTSTLSVPMTIYGSDDVAYFKLTNSYSGVGSTKGVDFGWYNNGSGSKRGIFIVRENAPLWIYTNGAFRVAIDSIGNLGISESDPETPIELTHATPYLTLHNSTHEDTGRESRLNFKGEQSGGEETTLARIEVHHDGAVDDQKGWWGLYTNDGSDDDAPTLRMSVDSAGLVDVVGDFTAGTIQADDGTDYDGLLSGITNITIVGGIITAVS